ncbi:MAG: dockerin type I repeat-containing protein [Clostridia bacterium]|nr:dockerin type I repeat-containing protein [Clostridia bacterium]
MKVYIKLISFVLALVIALAGLSAFCASAEETTYTQPEKFIYGDVDLDGNVTVKDATLIQKGLAKVTYVTAVQRYLADPDGTGYSIKNATAIQKYLAKYKTTTPWNTEIIMASQDEFSSQINTDGNFKTDRIIIYPTNTKQEYTLSDFPEYIFTKIVKTEYDFNPEGKYYTLYLTYPNKSNVLTAIELLDYRANIDLKNIYPSYSLVAS